MEDRKVIAIAGATGGQGGGLARAILADPQGGFAVRALTRDPNSGKARALAELGAEVVKVDIDDEHGLARAFEGAHGAFCVTFFWDHYSPARETAEAGNMARAAKQAGLKHVIWSTFEDTRDRVPLSDNRMPTLMERYKVPHFDSKAEGNRFFTELGVPTTFLLTSFYWENFIRFGMGPQKGPDGRLAISFPLGDKKLPGIAVEDIGRCAYQVFRRGREMIGRTLGISGDQLSGTEMAEAFAQALGREVIYNAVAPDAYRGFGFPGAQDLGNMFQYKRDFNEDYCRVRDPAATRALHPGLLDFRQWLAANKEGIPV